MKNGAQSPTKDDNSNGGKKTPCSCMRETLNNNSRDNRCTIYTLIYLFPPRAEVIVMQKQEAHTTSTETPITGLGISEKHRPIHGPSQLFA